MSEYYCPCCGKVHAEFDCEVLNDMNRLIQKAGNVIGTDPDLRSVACIDVALDYLKEKMNESNRHKSIN